MTHFRREIQRAVDAFTGEFTITNIREFLGWDNTVCVDTRIRYSLDRLKLQRSKPSHVVFYSHK